MDTSVTLGQLIGAISAASIVITGAGLLFWKNSDVKQATFEVRLAALEKGKDSLEAKMDTIMTVINELKIMLQNKVDRENHSSHIR